MATTASGMKGGLNWIEDIVDHMSTYILMGILPDGRSTYRGSGGSSRPYITSIPEYHVQHDYANNNWNSSTLGNYYANINAIDSDNNSINDTAYNISGNDSIIDNYLLVVASFVFEGVPPPPLI